MRGVHRGAGQAVRGRAAEVFRVFHILIAVIELAALGYVLACGLRRRRDSMLRASVAALLVQGVALPEHHQRLGQYIDQQQQRLDDLTAKADTPFAHGDELDAKRRDLAVLHAELTAITEPGPAPEPAPAEQPQPIRPTRPVGIDL